MIIMHRAKAGLEPDVNLRSLAIEYGLRASGDEGQSR